MLRKNFLFALPVPISLNYWWNFGSLLGVCLALQIFTGIFLSISYTPDATKAFERVIKIYQDVNFGWLLQNFHARGASIFFFCLYFHIGRGLYFKSYRLKEPWMVGVSILMCTIATAFLGYVLPWGQMSFWGATVITGLISTFPYGDLFLNWLWGGISVSSPTLNRFFVFHFLLPFLILFFVVIHILFLHFTGSSNPLSTQGGVSKVPFYPFFVLKDTVRLVAIIRVLTLIILWAPDLFTDAENFSPASTITTPPHIQPEWYFLFAYAILRRIPNKLGGVLALFFSVASLWLFPLFSGLKGKDLKRTNKVFVYFFVATVLFLTWFGRFPSLDPFIIEARCLTAFYFIFIATPFLSNLKV